ncbi:serine hydrolase domain-containing protein [Kitasatospora phosalacinea]|uniref:serine hydrolase domain-containing protein n=1 Tax=Kitasatospora phosalacinea TaxID=2065 RepID=UPI000AEA2A4F|nr:serine hydrolase domain-containing protein [Kitasatospora phosalacinea]
MPSQETEPIPVQAAGPHQGGVEGADTAQPPLADPDTDADADAAPDTDLDRLLRPLFAAAAPEGGIAVAVVRGTERTVACRGYADRAGERPVRADTRFELGSVTKTFTALLLADMVARGEVDYDDPIDRYLPAEVLPGYPHERPITLLHLATHTSGLPRLPVDLTPAAVPRWFTSPSATFSAAHLLRALPRTPVRGTPGTRVRYSSLGAGLLGLVLERAAGQRYQELLTGRVCEPLGLIDTSCATGRDETTGYRRGRWIPSFKIPALPGAAALRSTADDMLRYLQAHLAVDAVPIPERTGAAASLRTALREVCLPRVARRGSGQRIGLSWHHPARPPGSRTARWSSTAAPPAAAPPSWASTGPRRPAWSRWPGRWPPGGAGSPRARTTRCGRWPADRWADPLAD